jgi:hypothetical protein
MTQEEALAIWRVERNAQIDWMREQTLAGVYPHGPLTRPMPQMTAPPPYSPAWYALPGPPRDGAV